MQAHNCLDIMSCGSMNIYFHWDQGAQTMKTWTRTFGHTLYLLVLEQLHVHEWVEWTETCAEKMYSTVCLCPFQGFPPITPLNTLPQLCVLLLLWEHTVTWTRYSQHSVQPCMKDRPCEKKKTNLGLWNLSQRREEALCNPLSSLYVWSCPKCFLQNRCNRESGFLRWSLCFWAIMKRGKAQTHTV